MHFKLIEVLYLDSLAGLKGGTRPFIIDYDDFEKSILYVQVSQL